MRDALWFGRVRIRTLRSTYWLVASALLLDIAVAFAVASSSGRPAEQPDRRRRRDRRWLQLAGALRRGFLAVMGILTTGHEDRHSTVQPTLTTVPQRSALRLI